MNSSQESNSEKNVGAVTIGQRIAGGAVFAVIFAGFAFLWAGAKGFVEMGIYCGVCGFKQSYGLPCPGCYWTTSGKALVQGRIWEAFYVQPAAAVIFLAFGVVAVSALLRAVFGVKFLFLRQMGTGKLVKYIVVSLLIIIAAGWAVTLVREMV